ncbi:MAG: ATP-dependent DNA helicase RecQ [Prevotellaceae bacterium]|nr:ATP-dependent DNA helicase RecQ [Prevotellaceae bacterium]
MDKFQETLKRYWGYDDFRGIQREIIESITAGNDTLGLMPTGGGKSITFQVPAMMMDGVCLVVTPLIALMKDQVANLRRRGILAKAIYSGMSHEKVLQTMEDAIYGGVKILYVSPERLTSELFRVKLSHMDISFITVDEAHCICQWGYDFRPPYLQIAEIRKIHPDAPVLALTATATKEVVKDIQDKLGFKRENVFRMSFERKNLSYVVRTVQDKFGQLEHILRSVSGTAIVYTRTRKRTRELAEALTADGISSVFYHAGLSDVEKNMRQRAWQNDEVRVMVATNAFGMGIDKPDVRVVVHYDSPDSVEAYFQEAGRAGRDGKKAYAVMLYNGNEKAKLLKRVAETFPEKDFVRKVYERLAYFYQIAVGFGDGWVYEFNIDKFCTRYKFFPTLVESSLMILQRAGYISYELDYHNKSRFMFTVEREQLYRLDTDSEKCNDLIMLMLRTYPGLFSEFQYIDEPWLANKLGLQEHQVYFMLKYLSRTDVAQYIPKKSTPYIIYTRDRVDGVDVKIDAQAYDDRKRDYQRRIEAMVNYLTNDEVCRSRQLLSYFGEKTDKKCGICDVCLDSK